MKKSLCVLAGIAVLATPALAQVRPANCAPVFPLMDKVAAVVPQDVTVAQAAPAAVAKKGFFGLPLLLPLLAAGGACVVACGGGGGGDNNPASPA